MPHEKKYAALARILPRLNVMTDANYQQKVQVMRDGLVIDGDTAHDLVMAAALKFNQRLTITLAHLSFNGEATPSALGKIHLAMRAMVDGVSALKSAINLIEEAVEQQLLEAMFEADVDALSITGTGKTIGTSPEPYPQVKDREALRLWVDADPDLRLAQQLPYKTLEGLVKRMLLAGQATPPGVEVYIRDRIRVT